MDYKAILFEKRDNVAYITLNRPDDANALDLTTAEELHQAALDCDQDEDVRGILITGKGRMFLRRRRSQVFPWFRRRRQIASDAGDVTLPSRCFALQQNGCARRHGDQRYGSGRRFQFRDIGRHHTRGGSAKFTLAYTAAGLSPDGSSTYLLPRYIGLRRAKELMLTNRLLTAAEAADYDIVDRVVPDDQLMEEAEKQVRAFASGPTKAFGAVKRLLDGTFKESLETQMELESRSIASLAASGDGAEGIDAFVGKRKPDFKGK